MTVATITEVRDALAERIKEALDLRYGSGRVPSPILPLSVFIIPKPGGDYYTFEDATFCRPAINLSAVVVGPTTNPAKAYAWLDAAIQVAPSALADDPTLGGMTSHIVFDAVSEPGLLDVNEGNGIKPYLSAELRFKPFALRGD